MKGEWKDLFAFNKRERNGIIVLITLIILLLIFQLCIPLMMPDPIVPNSKELDSYILALKKDSIEREALKKEKTKRWKKDTNYFKSRYYSKNNSSKNKVGKPNPIKIWNPVKFNPNLIGIETWLKFSLTEKQAMSIENYKLKGGQFRVKSDVKKMYVISDSLFAQMKRYIELPDSVIKSNKSAETRNSKSFRPTQKPLSIEINSADTTELKTLKGIGSYYANRIVKYRVALGGYQSVEQLYEIERMRESTVQKITPFIYVDTNQIVKIKINSATATEMVKHPYITWNMAINIHDYRAFKKKYKSVHELVELGLLNEEIYSKLAVYLEL
ncbi:MAG: helix-hairpin-helix domain-containing protein [Salibacteraceae bacterium]